VRMAIVWSGIVFIYLAERLQGRSSECFALALLCPRLFIVFFVVVCYCFVLFNIIMREDSHFQWKCNR